MKMNAEKTKLQFCTEATCTTCDPEIDFYDGACVSYNARSLLVKFKVCFCDVVCVCAWPKERCFSAFCFSVIAFMLFLA